MADVKRLFSNFPGPEQPRHLFTVQSPGCCEIAFVILQGWTGFEKSAYPQVLGLCPGGRFEWIRGVSAAGAFTPSLFPEPHPRPRLRNRLLFSLFSHWNRGRKLPLPSPPLPDAGVSGAPSAQSWELSLILPGRCSRVTPHGVGETRVTAASLRSVNGKEATSRAFAPLTGGSLFGGTSSALEHSVCQLQHRVF